MDTPKTTENVEDLETLPIWATLVRLYLLQMATSHGHISSQVQPATNAAAKRK